MDKEAIHELIFQIKNGDLSVLKEVYLTHRKPFLKFGERYNLAEADLLDIYQDSILALFDNIKNGKIDSLESSLKTYIFSIGKYMIFKNLKRLDKVQATALDMERLKYYTDEVSDNQAFDKEDIALYKACFNQLGKQCQELLQLFYYRGYTLEDIQETLNYDNYNVVKSQKSRCLKHLKELINKRKHGL